MELLDKAAIFRFHNTLADRFGTGTLGSLGWMSPLAQDIRFKILAGIGNLNNSSLLDAGCGHGDLRRFLGEHYTTFRYYGVEQIPGILQEALERYSHLPETYFFEGDFSAAALPFVDYILASGSLNYRNSDPFFVLKVIEKLFTNCRIGFGFNLLRKDDAGGLLETYEPDYILGFCRKLTDNVRLIEGYYEDDFTIFLYHQGV